jgi:hypothetical protein
MSDNVVKKAQQEQAQDLPAHNALTTLLLVLSASTMLQEQQLLRETGCMKRETRSEHLSCTQQKDRKHQQSFSSTARASTRSASAQRTHHIVALQEQQSLRETGCMKRETRIE